MTAEGEPILSAKISEIEPLRSPSENDADRGVACVVFCRSTVASGRLRHGS